MRTPRQTAVLQAMRQGKLGSKSCARRAADIVHSRPCVEPMDLDAVQAVLNSEMICQGTLVAEFEREVGRFVGLPPGVAAASGTASLQMALHAMNVGPEDEVIVPTYVCRSVLNAVRSVGARPVLCDVNDDWNMSAEEAEPHLGSRTAAIIAVHIFGIPADVSGLVGLGIPVIEDCCHAFGATLHGRKVGTQGSVAFFSFHAGKCLTTGEGGMLLSADGDIIERAREIRDGLSTSGPAIAAPLTDLQAALGLSQLSRYPNFRETRRRIADRYFHCLKDCDVRLPYSVRENCMFFRFPLRTAQDFATLRAEYAAHGIHVRKGVDCLLHRLIGLPAEQFPVAESLFEETVCLPIYPALSEREVDRVVEATRCIFAPSQEVPVHHDSE